MRIIAGKWKKRKILPPAGKVTRPTSDQLRETIFNILLSYCMKQSLDFENFHVLDIFAGTGALGLEALSRGALSATFIENDRQACQIIHYNVKSFGCTHAARVLQKNALLITAAERLAHIVYDLVFLDAPYHQGLSEKALYVFSQQGWFEKTKLVVIETSSEEHLTFEERWIIKDQRQIGRTKIWLLAHTP